MQELLVEDEQLLWSGPRWRGPLSYLRERPALVLLVGALLLRGGLRLMLLVGASSGSFLDAYTPFDVAVVMAAAWFGYELIALQAIQHFVTDRRVGLTHLGGATWREGHPRYDVVRRRGGVTLDWGRGPNHMQLGAEPLEEPVTGRLRFRLAADEAQAVEALLTPGDAE